MAVHSILPLDLTAAVDEVLGAAGVPHIAHDDDDPVGAAEKAAADPQARALIGPFRSADVNEALAATAPARLPLIAPVATWVGITRDDEPGCDDARPNTTGPCSSSCTSAATERSARRPVPAHAVHAAARRRRGRAEEHAR